MGPTIIEIPQININDKEVFLSEWSVGQGQCVSKGDSIVEMETAKRILDLKAEETGFLYYKEGGKSYKVGEVIGVILDVQNKELADSLLQAKIHGANEKQENGIKITEKARKLAEERGISIWDLNTEKLIKEKDVLNYIHNKGSDLLGDIKEYMKSWMEKGNDLSKAIIIVGSGDMAKMIIESMKSADDYIIIGCLDRSVPVGSSIVGVPVIGKSDEITLNEVYKFGVKYAINAVVGSDFKLSIRRDIFGKLKNIGFELPTIIHPEAYVESSATLAKGCFVHARTYIGTEALVGEGTIILTGAIISHNCEIGKNVYLAPGCILGGYVKIGDEALVGMGVSIFAHVSVDGKTVIVNGTDVFNNIKNEIK